MKNTLSFFVLFFCVLFFTDALHAEAPVRKYQDPSYLFCAPLHFTKQGIHVYLQTIFNDPSYTQNFLPYSFSHFIQFLEHAHSTHQTTDFMEYSLRLFCNKIKAAPHICADAFAEMVEELPRLMTKNIMHEYPEINFDDIQNSFKNTMYEMFLNRFSAFKQEPEKFLNDLSSALVKKVDAAYCLEERLARERLTQMIVRFLDITTLKLMWSPVDQEAVWKSVLEISERLATLMDKNIITRDGLDDVYRSLIERFCYFLDLAGSELSADVLKKIKEDVLEGKAMLFQLEEQEDLIETRAERLLHMVVQTEAKQEAKKFGLITDVIMHDGNKKTTHSITKIL